MRWALKLLGTSDLTGIGDGTVTGALTEINARIGLIQHGTARNVKVNSNGNAETVVTFPVAFDNVPTVVITQRGANLNHVLMSIASVSKIGFTMYGFYDGGTADNMVVEWIAVQLDYDFST